MACGDESEEVVESLLLMRGRLTCASPSRETSMVLREEMIIQIESRGK